MKTPVLVVALSALLPSMATAQKEPALARTEQLIAAFKKVKTGPAQAKDPAFAELDALIDYETITTRAISPRADKLTAAQKMQFQKKFRELIRLIAYPNSGDFFRKAKLSFKPLKAEDGQTLVPLLAKLPEEDLETELALHWGQSAEGLKLVDISFDGDSLVRDYQNQLTRIVDKEGAQGLLKKLDARRAALDRETPGAERPAGGAGSK